MRGGAKKPSFNARNLMLASLIVVFSGSPVLAEGPVFVDSGQALGSADSYGVALGDVDGDLDAFVANSLAGNRVWLNDGTGVFSDTGQNLGSAWSTGVALGRWAILTPVLKWSQALKFRTSGDR